LQHIGDKNMSYIEEHANSNQSDVFFKIEPTLTELLDRATADKERITLTYKNQFFLAAIPIEEDDLIEEIEDIIDNKAIREALKEAEEKGTISSEQLDKKLGW
jgi:hypothetical protein